MNVSIEEWLDALASSAPAPGGGAAGAFAAAIAAALIEMATSLTIGKPAYAEHEAGLVAVHARAGDLRREALELVEEDATAFQRVIDAYRLPRETDDQRETRTRRIQEALVAAAEVPRRTATNASEAIELAARIVPWTNVNVVSDVAMAAASARAALVSALVNVEANRNGIDDVDVREELRSLLVLIGEELDRADGVVDAVRSLTAAA